MQVTIPGTIMPDGSLQLDAPVTLPAGKVNVLIESASSEVKDPAAEAKSLKEFFEEIWAASKARGEVPRTAEEIDADIAAMRNEWEERQLELEALQLQGEEARQRAANPTSLKG
jgi:hypothetical protein